MRTVEIVMTVILVALEVPAAAFLIYEWIKINREDKGR